MLSPKGRREARLILQYRKKRADRRDYHLSMRQSRHGAGALNRRMIDEAAIQKGKETEERFFKAARQIVRAPSWFLGVRRSTPEWDAVGFDAFVATDEGDIPIQIKSSHTGAHEFHRKHPNHPAIVMVIHEGMDDDQIISLILRLTTAAYQFLSA